MTDECPAVQPAHLTGDQRFAAIRSYTATASKNNINTYQTLVQLAEGNPWLPQPT